MISPLELPRVFTDQECRRIVELACAGTFDDAGLVGGLRGDNARRSRIYWLEDEGPAGWVFRRMLECFAKANREHFDFALEEFAERMQVAWYGAEPDGFFDWHVDHGNGPVAARRKLTVVVQLSDASSYAGGDLETNADGHVRSAPRDIGSAAMFPSFVLHRVSPVTEGERYSLTLWAHGPAFR